jgi:hypothetical protein
MSDERSDRQFEALFSDFAPEPDPRLREQTGVPLLEQLAAPSEREMRRLRTLKTLLAVGVIGEGAAVMTLVFTLYRSIPAPADDSQLLLTSAAFVCMGLVLLFVQWQLASRLFQAEQGVRERQRQLDKVLTEIRRSRGEFELAAHVTRRHQKSFALCTEIGRLVAQRVPMEAFVEQVVEQMGQHFAPSFVGLFSLDASQEEVALLAAAGSAQQFTLSRLARLTLSESALLRETVEQGEALTVGDVQTRSQGKDGVRDPFFVAHKGSAMAAPVMIGERVLGAITVQVGKPRAFRQEDVSLLNLVAGLTAIVVADAG